MLAEELASAKMLAASLVNEQDQKIAALQCQIEELKWAHGALQFERSGASVNNPLLVE